MAKAIVRFYAPMGIWMGNCAGQYCHAASLHDLMNMFIARDKRETIITGQN